MKIVSYNVNGIRAAARLGIVDWLDSFDADIYCIQEVRANEDAAKEALGLTNQFSLFGDGKLSKYTATFNCGSVPGYAGTLILSKQQPDRVAFGMGDIWQDNEGRTTTTFFGNLAVVNAYIPNGNSRLEFKLEFFKALTKYIENLKKTYSVACMGDFNIAFNEMDVTHPRELSSRSVFLPIERQALGNLMGIGMVDSFRRIHPDLVKYSWRSYRSTMAEANPEIVNTRNSWKFRIDYIFVTDDIMEKVKSADILDVNYSDHLPAIIEY